MLDFILHFDKHLAAFTADYGLLTYILLFVIIFAETGLIVTPFLPGDSLLFAAGTVAALGSLDPWILFFLLLAAAILGDTVNYWVGAKLGPRIVASQKIRFINQSHIDRTNKFYDKHGAKTIVLARFVPIVRTFAPFVAGVGQMAYGKFLTYNIVGGLIWVGLLTWSGYFFGNLPWVKKNLEIVVIAIVFLSVLPAIIEVIKHKRAAKTV